MMFRSLAISSSLLALLTSSSAMAMEDESTESTSPSPLKRQAAEERLPEAISKKQKPTHDGDETIREEMLRRHSQKISQLNQDVNNGLPEAQCNLAKLLRAGLFYKRRWLAAPEPLRAKELFEAAARQGHPEAQSNLAHMLQWGVKDRNEKWVVEPDPLRAKAYYKAAAKQGARYAKCQLTNMFRYGVSDRKGGWCVEQNSLKAKKWSARADEGIIQ